MDHLLKTKKGFKNLKKRDISYIYKNELDKACFQHDMAYEDFKDIAITTGFDQVLRDKAFNIAKNPKYDGYQRGLASMICKFLMKSPLCFRINLYQVVVSKTKLSIMNN